jgi:hypothetical protein
MNNTMSAPRKQPIALWAFALAVMYGCAAVPRTPPTSSCIMPPEKTTGASMSEVLTIIAKLEKLPLDASLKSEFEAAAESTFSELSDENAALLIMARTMVCLLVRADSPEKVALVRAMIPSMEEFARTLWLSEKQLMSGPGSLTPAQLELIRASGYGEQVIAEYSKLGLL